MPAPLELAPQLAVVVDLPVLDHDDASVLVCDRLIARFEVDDRQALNADPDPAVAEDPARIGAPVVDHLAHPLDELGVDGAVERELAGYPAHTRPTLRR